MDLLPEIKQEISEFNTLLKIRQEAKSNRNNFEQEHQEQFTKFQATMVKHPAPDIAVMRKTTAESMSSSKRSYNKGDNHLEEICVEQEELGTAVSSLSVQLIHPAGLSSWSVQMVCPAGLSVYLRHILIISQANLRNISGNSQANLREIPGISEVYI